VKNQHLSLKDIAKIVKCSYGYARIVWCKYQKSMITTRGSPRDPYNVHGFILEGEVLAKQVDQCPIKPSDNRNLQKHYRGEKFTIVLHKKGNVKVYPYFKGWRVELKEFLCGFWNVGFVDLFVKSLVATGSQSVSVNAPYVPKNYRFKIKGLGTLITDSTPYKKGTIEFEYDPQFTRDIQGIKQAMSTFAVAMEQHVKLIMKLQVVSDRMGEVLEAMKGEKLF